jgi:hypothetical protein
VDTGSPFKPGLPDFSLYIIPKQEKIYQNFRKMYQMITERNTISFNISNGRKIYLHFPFQGPQKYAQFGTMGFEKYHLATLVQLSESRGQGDKMSLRKKNRPKCIPTHFLSKFLHNLYLGKSCPKVWTTSVF